MLALVINLDDQPTRLAHFQGQIANLGGGIEARRVPGVNGHALSPEELEAFRRASPRPTGWLPGQIGCLLSHREAWRAIANSGNSHGVVFEDDVHLAIAAGPFLRDHDWVPEQADVVRLEASGRAQKLGGPALSAHGRTLRPVLSEAWNGTAYVIRADVATMLLSAPRRWWRPLDFMLYDRRTSPLARALAVYQLDPAICEQDKFRSTGAEGFESSIEVNRAITREGRLRALIRPLARRLRGRTLTRFADYL